MYIESWKIIVTLIYLGFVGYACIHSCTNDGYEKGYDDGSKGKDRDVTYL